MNYSPEEQAANRATWVAALRSGAYKQGYGCLRSAPVDEGKRQQAPLPLPPPDQTVDTFCCLGVACDVSGLGKWVRKFGTNPRFLYECGADSMALTTLPEAVQAWLGIPSDTAGFPAAPGENDYDCLSGLNDRDKKSFAEIADAIEAIGTEWYRERHEFNWRRS